MFYSIYPSLELAIFFVFDLKMYLLPLEGVRGEELVTYSDVINIGLPIGEGLGGLLIVAPVLPDNDPNHRHWYE